MPTPGWCAINVAQILRLALFNADAVLQDSTTHRLYVQQEMIAWANDASNKMEKTLRQAKMDFNLLVLQSNDIAFRWAGQTYNPTVLQMTSDTSVYPLPPDLLELKYILPLTSGQEGLKFVHMDASRDEFKDMAADTNAPDNPIYFDVVGERSLLLANTVGTTTDVEIGYIPRSAPMQMYTTGTISISNASAAVTGTSTRWVVDELHHNLELIVSADANAPKVISQTTGGTWVDPSTFYYRVDSITADGNLTLSAPWLDTAIGGRGYMLATVPPIPQEHHHTLVKYVQAWVLKKARRFDLANTLFAEFKDDLVDMKQDIKERQSHDAEFAEEYDPAY